MFGVACARGAATAPGVGVVGTPAPDGGVDGGPSDPPAPDAGVDGGPGPDAGIDGGPDAGPGGVDAGTDGGVDAGTDGGVDAGTDGGVDAGTGGGVDAGTGGGVDAGTGADAGTVTIVPRSDGWHFAGDGLPSGSVMGASADEGGNLWVAGGSAGVFVQQAGQGSFRNFTIADGLHPYGTLSGQVAKDLGVPDGTPADRNPRLDATPVISVSGGPAGTAFVGYQGKPGCEDEWDRYGETLADHEKADPSIYKSGDADKIVLSGGGIAVSHFDIYSGQGVVPNEPLGREKLCTVHRILYEHQSNRVWLGANHGFAYGFADSAAAWEHIHPGINDVHNWMMTDAYYGIALDTIPHVDSKGAVFYDVWFGGMIRTTRFRFGETLGDYYAAQPRTEYYGGGDISKDLPAQAAYWNRMDIWPDPVGERWDPPHGDWKSREPDALKPSDWNVDNVTGIAVLKSGDAWISSHTNGLRRVNHDGQFVSDATAWLPSPHLGAIAKDPLDESVWIGFREPGFGIWRLRRDGTLLQYGQAALGANVNSAVWDIQVAQVNGARRIVVAFQRGEVGIYDGN